LLDLELLDPEAAVMIRQPDVRPAVQAGVIAFFSFAAGAAVPLLPYLLDVKRHPLMMGCCLASLAVFFCGWRMAGMAGRIALWGGLRSVLAGWSGGSLSYLAGNLVAVVI
jgi:VIT1/CCC1 family predicted Fe2+/Mn2+ transporter